jgi:hypothetical protein
MVHSLVLTSLLRAELSHCERAKDTATQGEFAQDIQSMLSYFL